jgi:hypothetical protein
MGAGERKIAFRLPMVTCSDAFFDIEILLSRIRNPQSKVYFLDAATAYKARVLGGALTSAWVAITRRSYSTLDVRY